MKSTIYFFVFFLVIFISCKKENELSKPKLTYSFFKDNLKSDMTYNSFVTKFGEPTKDIGSGIHIYVFKLNDSTEIWIGYTDKIMYATHMDKNQQLIVKLF